MDVNVQQVRGNWTLGYSLDKHALSSTPIGENEYGHMQFDTVRSPVGEALFQLKYRSDYSKISLIANQMARSLTGRFADISFVIAMPPSKQRQRQPVVEIAKEYARVAGLTYYDNFLIKTVVTSAMKDIALREDKINVLVNAFKINDFLPSGKFNVLLIDDLFDTGSSLEAATQVLKSSPKIGNVYVATVTRKR